MATEQAGFGGMQVAALESRHAEAMARMIEQFGGVAHVSPSLREVPMVHNPQAIDFAHRLMTGQIDMVIFMTGVGTRHLMAQLERHVARDRFLAALSDVTTVARGPKPVAALKELGIVPTHGVPEPNTWREVLATLDANCYLANSVVALQEYGQPNPSLTAGLEARGANVISLKVYDWELPEDTGPLEANVRAMADGRIDVVLFTSAHQVTNVVKTAEALDLSSALRRAMRRMVVASVGPTTSEQLHTHEFPVDIEPEHPKMGHLVQTAAARAGIVKQRKDQIAAAVRQTTPGAATTDQAPWHNSLFMKACRLEPCQPTPVWLMRQVGRYLPEYRKLREKVPFLELC
jgi:uroporphyrinogen-III synthase